MYRYQPFLKEAISYAPFISYNLWETKLPIQFFIVAPFLSRIENTLKPPTTLITDPYLPGNTCLKTVFYARKLAIWYKDALSYSPVCKRISYLIYFSVGNCLDTIVMKVPIVVAITINETICLCEGKRTIASRGNLETKRKIHQLLGFGGGLILEPLFLEMGVPRQVLFSWQNQSCIVFLGLLMIYDLNLLFWTWKLS